MTPRLHRKAPSAAASLIRPNRLLPLLFLLLALVYASGQFFIADPGDGGGSGIGGTGRLGGESGLGGTGAPFKFGAVDEREDREAGAEPWRDVLHGGQLGSLPQEELASSDVKVETLRLSPLPPHVLGAPSRALASARRDELESAREKLEDSLEEIDRRALADARQDAMQRVSLEQAAPSPLAFEAEIRQLIDEDRDSAARQAVSTSLAVTRQLMLAEAASRIALPDDAPAPVHIDVIGDPDHDRLRLNRPARPERPDRPSTPTQRLNPPTRSIPTPPVRPMHL